MLEQTVVYEELATLFQHATDALFLGWQLSFPVVLEGALRLKDMAA